MRRPARVLLALACLASASLACRGRLPPVGDDAAGEGEGEGEGAAAEGEGEGEGAAGEGEGEGVVDPTAHDVTLDAGGLAASVRVSHARVAASDCLLSGGCATGEGIRALLRFEVVVRNASGSGPIELSSTSTPASCGPAAAHGLVTARLRARDGSVALERALDVQPFSIGEASSARVPLGGCDALDVTDVSAGDYVLELALDGTALGDADVTNNTASADVVIVPDLACSTGVVCGGTCCPSAGLCVNDACQLPDLSVDAQQLYDTEQIQEATFSADSCATLEGCVDGTGNRRLLRFSTTTPNSGNVDLFMGRPEQRPELFTFSSCHQHYHFEQYADYRLLDVDGNVVRTGHKQAFCLIDLQQRDPSAGGARYDCSFQGISKGWADTYGSHLDCQWIDITDVVEGDYVLEVHVNPQHIFEETDYMNNVARVPVHVPADPNACVPRPEICHNGRDEDCDDVVDNGCAPVTDAGTCTNGFTIDGSGLVVGEIAATDTPELTPSCAPDAAGGEFFVRFNVASPGLVYLSTYGSSFDTVLSVVAGNDCATGAHVQCADDGCGTSNEHFLGVMQSGAYTAVVKAKRAGDVGRVQLKIQQAGCASAQPLATNGQGGDVVGSTTDDVDSTSPSCATGGNNACSGAGPDELWYFMTCPGAWDARVSTCGAGVAEGTTPPQNDQTTFDTMLELRAGGCLGDPVPSTCSDDVAPGQIRCSLAQSELRASGAGDGLWFALVDGCEDDQTGTGNFELHLDLSPSTTP